MAIQIPSAAGFIPSESVIDGIAKLFNLFSPDAKALRKQQIEQSKAGIGLTQAQTTAVPEETKVRQRMAGVAETGAVTDAGKLPILINQQDNIVTQANADRAQRDKEFGLSFEQKSSEFQQQMEQRLQQMRDDLSTKNFGLKNEETRNNIIGEDLQLRRAQDDRQATERAKMLDDDRAYKIYQMSSMDANVPPDTKQQIIYQQLLKNFPPEVAKQYLEHFERIDKNRKLIKEKSSSLTKGLPAYGD